MRAERGGSLGDDSVDVAVFRFTLGIPGFEDRLVPRVVGLAAGVLLFLNHVLGATPTPDAQTRAEVACAVLAVVGILVPEIELRLREALPGRGRQATADNVAGGTSGFFLSSAANEACKQELAWASFALLRNTNSCGLLVHSVAQRDTLMARGLLGSAAVKPGAPEESLRAVAQAVESACSSSGGSSLQMRELALGKITQLWLPDRSAISSAGLASAPWLPAGAECLLAQAIGGPEVGRPAGLLLSWSERARAFTDRERSWYAAMARKLADTIAP